MMSTHQIRYHSELIQTLKSISVGTLVLSCVCVCSDCSFGVGIRAKDICTKDGDITRMSKMLNVEAH